MQMAGMNPFVTNDKGCALQMNSYILKLITDRVEVTVKMKTLNVITKIKNLKVRC